MASQNASVQISQIFNSRKIVLDLMDKQGYNINDYDNSLNQQKLYYKNTAVPFYPGVLVKSGSTIQSDALMSQFIQSNRNKGFKGEVFFFYEGLKDKLTWYQGLYPFIK